jgi:hypothetical protein
MPHVTHVAILYDPEQPTSPGYITLIEATAPSFRVQIRPYPVRDAEAIELAFETLAADPNGGLILLPGALLGRHRDLITSLAARFRLPHISAFRYYVTAGGLATKRHARRMDGHWFPRQILSKVRRVAPVLWAGQPTTSILAVLLSQVRAGKGVNACSRAAIMSTTAK